MIPLKLSEIAKCCNGTYNCDVEINSVVIDTRKIEKGCLFICIKGERFDAHQFIDEAFEKGAAAVMVSRDVNIDKPFVKVDDTANQMLNLAGYYRSKFNIPVVGLTGSVGKTTTKEFTSLVVSSKYNTVKTQGNLNNEIGLPQMLFQFDESTQAAVIEMGMNHFGEIHRLVTATKPTVGVITNIGVSHIENLGSREGILKAKLEILDGIEEGSPLIINADNDMLKTVLDNDDIVDKYNVITIGIDGVWQYRAVNINEENGSTSFDINYCVEKNVSNPDGPQVIFATKKQHVVIPTIGIHNVYNALVAFATGIVLGIDSNAAANALANYVPAGMRQKVVNVNGIISVEDCYNASPDSMKAGITTLADLKANKKIAVLSDMLELGEYSKDAHYNVGKFAGENNIDCVYCVGNDAQFIVKGAKDFGVKEAILFADKQELTNKLYESVKSGDAVLFKASRGMKLEEVISSIYKRWES